MANLIKKVGDRKVYHGILTDEQIKQADKMQAYLEEVIPKIEEVLKNKYPKKKDRLLYAYEFGLRLNELAKQFEVNGLEVRIFIRQIREFATKDENIPKDRSDERQTYEYYYKLAQIDVDAVKNMKWGEWVYLFDVKEATREKRFFVWLSNKLLKEQIKRDLLRLFMTGVKIFITGKDLAVYTDKQIYQKYEMIYEVTNNWCYLYNKYFSQVNKQPTEARIKNKKKYQEKYFKEVYLTLKRNKDKKIFNICDEVFRNNYYIRENEE